MAVPAEKGIKLTWDFPLELPLVSPNRVSSGTQMMALFVHDGK
jgi:hypothetical protein